MNQMDHRTAAEKLLEDATDIYDDDPDRAEFLVACGRLHAAIAAVPVTFRGGPR